MNNDKTQREMLWSWDEKEIKIPSELPVLFMVLIWVLRLISRRIDSTEQEVYSVFSVGLDDPYCSSGSGRWSKEFILLYPQGRQSDFFKIKSVPGGAISSWKSFVKVRWLCFQIVFFLEYKVNVGLTLWFISVVSGMKANAMR